MVALSWNERVTPRSRPPDGVADEPPSTRTGALLRVTISLALAVALVVGLYALSDRETLSSLLRTVDPMWLGLSFAAFCLGTAIRARRFEVLSRPHSEKTVAPYLRVTAIHQLLLMVLPFRMGELSYPVLMRRHLGRAVPHGVGDLVLVRLLDLVLAGTCFGLGLLALPRLAAAGNEMLVIAGVVVALGSWGVLKLPPAIHLSRSLLLGLSRVAPMSSPRSARRFMRELDHSIRRIGRKTLAVAAALSIALTAVGVVRIYFLFAAFRLETGLLASALLLGASNLLGLIPLHGFGGLGPKQAGMAGILVLLGFASTTAASLTLLFQATIILFVGVLGMGAYGSWLVAGRRPSLKLKNRG